MLAGSPDGSPFSGIQDVGQFHKEQYQHFAFHILFCQFHPALQIIMSEPQILPDKLVQLPFHEGSCVQTEFYPFHLRKLHTLQCSISFTFPQWSFDIWRWLNSSQWFPNAWKQICVSHWCSQCLRMCLATLEGAWEPETLNGSALSSRSWERSGEVNFSTSVVSMISDTSTMVARSSRSFSKVSWSECARYWLRWWSWAHNLWELTVRPDVLKEPPSDSEPQGLNSPKERAAMEQS